MFAKGRLLCLPIAALVALGLAACSASSSSSSGGTAASTQSSSSGSSYPTRPITLIVPFAAGGPADVTARLFAQYATSVFHQTVNVEDVTGGSGITGVLQAIKAPADGYTLFVDSQATSGPLAATFSNLPFTLTQRTYISELAEQDQFFVVNAASSYKTLSQVMNFARTQPSQFSWAAAAAGSSVEYGILQLLNAANVPIPQTRKTIYQSGLAAASAAVASGEDLFGLVDPSEAQSLSASGKVRVLAVAADQRDSVMPSVPSTLELGYKGADLVLFQALAGPPGLPSNVIQAWEKVIKQAVTDPALIKKATAAGYTLTADRDGPGMASYVNTEYQSLLKLAVSSGTRQ